jgi:alpha-beta hydrolase superfamily lysophospholipase
MIDTKGFGYSSGTRAGSFVLQDSHEQIGLMLKRFRTDKPAFLIGHSMGSMNI